MKLQTTQKAVKQWHTNIIRVGYCDCYYLTKDIEPQGYTCGVYGWNCDIYSLGNTAIVTGYRPFGNISNHAITRKYEQKAREIYENSNFTELDKARKKIQKLRDKWITELIADSEK